MSGTILLIGTLDTKGAEYAYLRDRIIERGHQVLVMDAGIVGEPPFTADFPASVVAEAAGETLEGLREKADRGQAVDAMTRGAQQLALQLYSKNQFQAILGLGGSGGTIIATSAMRALPVGMPKVMVSTLASGDIAPYIGVKDITMMYSVVDIAGLNRISKRILSNAAGAVCGMIEQTMSETGDKPLLAATMFGVTTPCVEAVRGHLEEAGYELLVFHATGSGGKAMEALIEDGFIEGVADITTTELCDELAGGVLSAGPNRLQAAGRKGIPQVVSCGALDMVNFWAFDTVPEEYRQRNLYKHNPNVTLMRTTPEECAELGRLIAEKLNLADGPTVLMLPLLGISAIDREGEPFYDPSANDALFNALREHIRPPVELVELDMHINDPRFAKEIAERLLKILDKK